MLPTDTLVCCTQSETVLLMFARDSYSRIDYWYMFIAYTIFKLLSDDKIMSLNCSESGNLACICHLTSMKIMTLIKRNLFAFAAAVLLSTPAFASLTYATGQDLNADGIDDQFTVNGAKAFLVTSAAQGWPALPQPNITSGRYISWDPIQSGRPSTVFRNEVYTYSFKFVWEGAQGTPAAQNDSTMFDFRWISDDYLTDVRLNGASLGVNNIGASKVWRISNTTSVAGSLLAGINTIDFITNNTGGGANGLAADFTIHGNAVPVVQADIPEPAPFALMGLALAGALLASRKRR